MEWNQQQLDIFEDAENGKGHTMVVARAGTGKTTTSIEAVRRVRGETVLMTAFNKTIATELQRRLQGAADAKTLHALGLASLRVLGDIKVDEDKGTRIASEVLGEKRRPALISAVRRGASMCKSRLVATDPDDLEGSLDQIERVLDDHDIDAAPWATAEELSRFVLDALKAAKAETQTVDFDDMVWLPVVIPVRVRRPYDRVFVDECQDMSPVQLALAMAYTNARSRVCFVGDPAQAIYGWRGASVGRMGDMAKELSMKELPLSVTYRCAKRIVAEAQKYVPDIQVHPRAQEGIVETVDLDKLGKLVRPGDFVLSRSNAPMVKQCLQFIRDGVRATIRGRDLGERLKGIVRRLEQSAPKSDAMLALVEEWRDREVARRVAKDHPYQHIVDLAACIEVLATGTAQTVEVLKRIDEYFTDGSENGYVILSSTHRAKGLEADRVFLLDDTYCKPRPLERGEDGQAKKWGIPQEEKNLKYVAVTRAKNELYFARGNGDQ